MRLLASLQPVLAAAGALAVAAGVLVAFGYPAEPALRALVAGSLGGADAWIATLLKTGPLLLAGLAVALAFRCGVWNIGAEGQLYAGALAATWVATPAAWGCASESVQPPYESGVEITEASCVAASARPVLESRSSRMRRACWAR